MYFHVSELGHNCFSEIGHFDNNFDKLGHFCFKINKR